MPNRNQEVRTISRIDLPELLAQWRREKRSGLALLTRHWPIDLFVDYGWALEEVFTLDDSVSWDDLAPIVTCSSLRRLAVAGLVGEDGARAIAENLTNLHFLLLGNNRLTDDSVRRLTQGLPSLQTTNFYGNESLRLPQELLLSLDAAGLRDYFRRAQSEGKRKLNEAKLIVVGNEAVGKTALVNYLIKDEPCRDTDKTPGLHIQERIEVTPWDTHHTTRDTEELRLNVWDFGGQEVTRETHKLFLTARSLYLVVLEARRENVADAENVLHDWMRAIRNRGGDDVPVIVVINKS
jgi:small GTP-binding protein